METILLASSTGHFGNFIMKDLIVLFSTLSVTLILVHEYDAFRQGEWKMFGFLRRFPIRTQYLIFLYAHIPFTFFLLYYLWAVISFNNFLLWIMLNIFLIFHFVIHLIALKWKSNVFHSIHSFIIIGGAAIMGFINLCLANYY